MAFGFNSNQVNLPHYQANQNLQSMFLQPQGNVYNINSTLFTLKDFLSLSLKGRWLITMANHITCAIDGVCYDTFDPSDRLIWCVYFVKD